MAVAGRAAAGRAALAAVATLAALAASRAEAASVASGAAVPEPEAPLPGLPADDACGGSAGSEDEEEECGLSLRQLRGQQRSVPIATDPLEKVDLGGGLNPTGEEEAKEVTYTPFNGDLYSPSPAPLHTFYVYRVVNDHTYPPVNVNAANLAGVLWYLHHEVVVQYPRKFGISKIIRYKVQTRATKPLWDQGMNFGVRAAFDAGQMTGPYICGRSWINKTNTSMGKPEPKFCDGTWKKSDTITSLNGKNYTGPFEWSEFGFFVGCNKLGEFPFPTYPVAYPDAIWYSLPGPCPDKPFFMETDECRAAQPGGFCGPDQTPTGQGDCTWTYEYAGEVKLNDVVGISKWDWPHFREWGKKEYDPFTDKGTGFSWWDGIHNVTENERRINETRTLFNLRYPDMPADQDLPFPPCDFSYGKFYQELYQRNPYEDDGTPCQEPASDSTCSKDITWAMRDGIHAHPDWYGGLGPSSSFGDFQRSFWAKGLSGCPKPCLS